MTDTTFAGLGLADPIMRALSARGHATPTPIQAQAIPYFLLGRDLLGIAQTGTGKTAAFALPILDRFSREAGKGRGRPPRALVLAPTRELAIQIGEEFRAYGQGLPIRHTVIFGGVGQRPQADAVARGVDVIVATPGRLLDLMNQRLVVLSAIQMLVLDEADRMLDMGFVRDVRKIMAALPKVRQSALFSATMPAEIAQLAGEILHNPARVEVAAQSTPIERIAQSVHHVEAKAKTALLTEILADPALARFRTGEARVLVATDIAARGIDIGGVTHVVNYELPNEPESYVHRIGRTARAGAEGVAISFCDPSERPYLRDIERVIRQRLPASGEPVALREEERPGPRASRPEGAGANKPRRSRPRRRRKPSGAAAAMA